LHTVQYVICHVMKNMDICMICSAIFTVDIWRSMVIVTDSSCPVYLKYTLYVDCLFEPSMAVWMWENRFMFVWTKYGCVNVRKQIQISVCNELRNKCNMNEDNLGFYGQFHLYELVCRTLLWFCVNIFINPVTHCTSNFFTTKKF